MRNGTGRRLNILDDITRGNTSKVSVMNTETISNRIKSTAYFCILKIACIVPVLTWSTKHQKASSEGYIF